MPGSWSDFLKLRSGPAPAPSPEAGAVRVYADADGALRSVQSDGTDAAIGGGGGGASPVYSWLGANLNTPLTATGNAAWDHPADALEGSDLSISGDGETVSFLTSGLYVVSLYLDTTGTPPAHLDASPQFANPAAGTYWNVADTTVGLTVDADNAFQITYPPAKVVAGDSMVVFCIITGTMELGTGSTLWVTRIA